MSVRKWDALREFALSLPCATEDFPWGEPVVKIEKRWVDPPPWRKHLVHGPMFPGSSVRADYTVAVKLAESYERRSQLAHERCRPAHSGLGQWGLARRRLSVAGTSLRLGRRELPQQGDKRSCRARRSIVPSVAATYEMP